MLTCQQIRNNRIAAQAAATLELEARSVGIEMVEPETEMTETPIIDDQQANAPAQPLE